MHRNSALSALLLGALAAGFLSSPVAAQGTARADDVVPAAIDALLAEPTSPVFFGIPQLLPAEPINISRHRGQARSLIAVGDVNGDGAEDFAVGYAPGSAPAALQVRDGRTGQALWSAVTSPTTGLRSFRGLTRNGSNLVAGFSSPKGRVESRVESTGRLLWARDLASAPVDEWANVSAVTPYPESSTAGLANLLVAGGAGIDGATVLSGTDGSTLWSYSAGDVVYDARPAHDHDNDGLPEVIIVGGDDGPFARLLSGADGSVIWDVPLDGPGSVVLPIGDINKDGINDLAVGQFNAPGICLISLSGADGSRLWEAQGVFNDVTDLALFGDLLGTGFSDVAVGSFDNAVTVVLAINGNNEWRREGTTNNGGNMLKISVTDDLDGNGQPELLTCSVDHRLYLLGGVGGQWMADFDLGDRAVVTLALPDHTGDGRPEIVVGGEGFVGIFDGAAGLVNGPVVDLIPATVSKEGLAIVWAYPGTFLWAFVSTGIDSIVLPGWDQPFGLDLSRTMVFHEGGAPGAGGTPKLIPPFDPSLVGLKLYFQAASLLGNGTGLLSDVAELTVRP